MILPDTNRPRGGRGGGRVAFAWGISLMSFLIVACPGGAASPGSGSSSSSGSSSGSSSSHKPGHSLSRGAGAHSAAQGSIVRDSQTGKAEGRQVKISPVGDAASGELSAVEKLISLGAFTQAGHKVDALMRKYPDDWHVALLAARLHRKMGLSSYAIIEYEQVRRAVPTMPEPLIALSQIHLENLSTELAQRLAREAVYLAPDSRDARLALVSALLAGQSVSQAHSEAENLARMYPGDPEVKHVLANAAQAFGENKKALELMVAAVEARPMEQGWLLELADLYQANNQYEKAESSLKTALDRDPQDVRALDRLAHLYEFKLLDYSQARRFYARLMAVLPGSTSAQAGLDRCQLKQGDPALSFRNFVWRLMGYHAKTEEPLDSDSSVSF